MRKLVIVLMTSAILMACHEQADDLHAQVKELQQKVQQHDNLLQVLEVDVSGHERHLQRLERQIDDASLGIPDLRTH